VTRSSVVPASGKRFQAVAEGETDAFEDRRVSVAASLVAHAGKTPRIEASLCGVRSPER
jgi:hypothetical protein